MRNDFNELSSRDKWATWKSIDNAVWACRCGNHSLPERCAPFPGNELHCGSCDKILTRRTGGGQSDPFKWVLVNQKPRWTDSQLDELAELVRKS